jgi:hypothetical protein
MDNDFPASRATEEELERELFIKLRWVRRWRFISDDGLTLFLAFALSVVIGFCECGLMISLISCGLALSGSLLLSIFCSIKKILLTEEKIECLQVALAYHRREVKRRLITEKNVDE